MTKSKKAEEIAALREKAWTPEDARRVLEVCAATGQTQAAFAREHGLRQERLSYWRSRLGRCEASPGGASGALVRFVPAVVKAASVSGACPAALVRLPRGVTVELEEVPPQWVAALFRELCEAGS